MRILSFCVSLCKNPEDLKDFLSCVTVARIYNTAQEENHAQADAYAQKLIPSKAPVIGVHNHKI